MQVYINNPAAIYYANQAALQIANNPVFHEQTQHVEMNCFFVRERVVSMERSPIQIDSKMQVANLLTKGLGTNQFQFLLSNIGIINLHAPS